MGSQRVVARDAAARPAMPRAAPPQQNPLAERVSSPRIEKPDLTFSPTRDQRRSEMSVKNLELENLAEVTWCCGAISGWADFRYLRKQGSGAYVV